MFSLSFASFTLENYPLKKITGGASLPASLILFCLKAERSFRMSKIITRLMPGGARL